MVKMRKIKCPHCGSFDTIKKGKREGSSRHFCKNCSRYFTCIGQIHCGCLLVVVKRHANISNQRKSMNRARPIMRIIGCSVVHSYVLAK